MLQSSGAAKCVESWNLGCPTNLYWLVVRKFQPIWTKKLHPWRWTCCTWKFRHPESLEIPALQSIMFSVRVKLGEGKFDHLPRDRGKNKKCLKPPSSVTPLKANVPWHWKIPMFNRKYIFIHGGFSSQSFMEVTPDKQTPNKNECCLRVEVVPFVYSVLTSFLLLSCIRYPSL